MEFCEAGRVLGRLTGKQCKTSSATPKTLPAKSCRHSIGLTMPVISRPTLTTTEQKAMGNSNA